MLRSTRRQFLALSAAAGTQGYISRATAQTPRPVKIGVLGDQSGMSADAAGPGSVAAARMAVNDFGGSVLGHPIEVISGDMQLKPDVAAQIAARWFDVEGVDMITDLPLTSAARAVVDIGRRRSKTTIITAAAATEFTGQDCSATNVHWTDDTYSLANATARTIVADGSDTWFFLTANYAFGAAMQEDATRAIEAAGGKVLASVRHPLGSPDFSSFLLQAISSGAKVIGLASVGGDTINAIKQAAEFGVDRRKQRLAGFLVFISDIHSLGLEAAQGLNIVTGFYWDQSPEARSFAERFFKQRAAMPTKSQAATYAATLHYLHSVATVGNTDAVAVNTAMRARPVQYFGRQGIIRADGRVTYDMTLYRVKSPAESQKPWDYYKEVRKIPADQAFRPLVDGKCPLVR
jgi:branched-chain amino acid transport system substrate-binding protein